MIKVQSLPLKGLKLVELDIHGDHRGFFSERFHRERFREADLPVDFFQDNHSRSGPGILRGLHYQSNPEQGKLVGVIRGKIFDVVVDVRVQSPTFGEWYGVELSDTNGRLLWVPPGFAHGFCVLEETADILYKVDAPYTPASEGGIAWDDPELAIQWPIAHPILSSRDQALARFSEYKKKPAFN